MNSLKMFTLKCFLKKTGWWLQPRQYVGRVLFLAWHMGTSILVTCKCINATAPCKEISIYEQGVTIGKVIKLSWRMHQAPAGEPFPMAEQLSVSGQTQRAWHIQCLEIRAVQLALECFYNQVCHQHVFVLSDNMAVVACINPQWGIKSHHLQKVDILCLVTATPFVSTTKTREHLIRLKSSTYVWM